MRTEMVCGSKIVWMVTLVWSPFNIGPLVDCRALMENSMNTDEAALGKQDILLLLLLLIFRVIWWDMQGEYLLLLLQFRFRFWGSKIGM